MLILIDCLIGIYAFIIKKLKANILPLVLAVICGLLEEIIAHYFKIKYRNNLAVYYFGGAFEYAFFAWFIRANIKSKLIKKFISASIIVYILVILFGGYSFLKESYADPYSAIARDNYLVIAKGLFLTICSIFYFKGIFDSISRYEYLNIYILLAVAGILFYFAFSTVFFASQTYLVGQSLKENPHFFTDILKRKSAAFSYAYSQLQDILVFLFLTNILLYLCILVAFLNSAFGKKSAGEYQF